MIEEKTVFVLGAGLSLDYGFPTGYNLRNKITNLLNWNNAVTPIPERIKILKGMGFSEEEIEMVRGQLEDGGFDTIDEFLLARKNERLRQLGKIGIAMALIEYENPNKFKHLSADTCFYRYLFKKMVENTTIENFAENSVSFVTYNYDRSLEFFLWNTLFNRYEVRLKEIEDKIMKKIKIIHVHGKLGDMHWQNPTSRDYKPQLDDVNLILASNGIINFDDIGEDHPNYMSARNEIKNADNVVFVGFGFHTLNLSRLVKDNCLDGKKRIIATCWGLGDREKKEIEGVTNRVLTSGNLVNKRAVSFANEYLTWLK